MSEPLAHRLDPSTLRETYDDPDAAPARIAQLRAQVRTAPDLVAELLARGELVDLLRGTDQLDEALLEGRRASDRAEIAATPPQQHLARLRLAQVHQRRGEFVESNLAFIELLGAADQFGPVIEAYTHDGAGRNAFDQRHSADACEHFGTALAIRERFGLPAEQIEASRLALDVARRLEQEDR